MQTQASCVFVNMEQDRMQSQEEEENTGQRQTEDKKKTFQTF